MDDETARRLHKRARIAAERRGFKSDADDIAQDVLLAFAAKPDSKQTIDQAVIDSIRSSRGRTSGSDDDSKSRRKRGSRTHLQFEEVEEMVPSPGTGDYRLGSLDAHMLDALERARLSMPNGGRIERAIFMLIHGYGYTQQEVGNLFGFTESRTCQRHASICGRIQETLLADEERDASRAREKSPAVEALLRDALSRMEREAPQYMAEEEPGTMEAAHEAGFDEWLT